MRTLVLVGLLSVACSRPNAAFDGSATSDSDGDGRPSTADTAAPSDVSTAEPPGTSAVDSGAVGSGTTGLEPETTSTLDGPRPDLLVEPSCSLQPAMGASIQLGEPVVGRGCPTGLGVWARVVSNDGGEVVLEECNNAECETCGEPLLPLSVAPLVVGEILPAGPCLRLEATTLLEEAMNRCHWGAITIHETEPTFPYLIATARSSDPTPAAIEMLGEAIPEPMHAFDCGCSTLQPVSDCCEQAGTPSFWAYVIDGMDVLPGEQAPIELPSLGLAHTFQVFQAQQIPGCNDDMLVESWAVVAP